MTKSSQNNVQDVGVDLGSACNQNVLSIDRATVPGRILYEKVKRIFLHLVLPSVSKILVL